MFTAVHPMATPLAAAPVSKVMTMVRFDCTSRRRQIRAAAWWVALSLQPTCTGRHRARCGKTWRHSKNRKYITYRNAARAAAAGKKHRTSGEVSTCGFWGMFADKQTHRQTHTSCSQYSAPLPRTD